MNVYDSRLKNGPGWARTAKGALLLIRSLLAASLLLLSASCATRLPEGRAVDVLAPLDPSALAMIELRSGLLGKLAGQLEAAAPAGDREFREAAKGLANIASRSRTLGLAFLPDAVSAPPLPSTSRGESDPVTAGLPPFEAAIAGNFDPFGVWLSFATSSGWKKRGDEWKRGDLSVSLPRKGLLVAGRDDLSGLLSRAQRSLPSPLPARIAALPPSDFLAWLPSPLERLGPRLGFSPALLEDLGTPPFDVAIRGDLDEGKEGLDLDIVVLTKSETAARLFQPALRLGWLFVGRSLPFALEGQPVFTREGELLRISGLRLPLSSLADWAGRFLGKPAEGSSDSQAALGSATS